MLRSVILSLLLILASTMVPTTPAASSPTSTPPQTCCGYWVGLTKPDSNKRYSMSNTFRGYPCVEYDRQVAEYFYQTSGASRQPKVDIICRGKRDEAEAIRKAAIRANGEPATAWSVPDMPNLK